MGRAKNPQQDQYNGQELGCQVPSGAECLPTQAAGEVLLTIGPVRRLWRCDESVSGNGLGFTCAPAPRACQVQPLVQVSR
jgi:hypothetical protein